MGIIVVDVPLHAAGRCHLQCSTGRPYVDIVDITIVPLECRSGNDCGVAVGSRCRCYRALQAGVIAMPLHATGP